MQLSSHTSVLAESAPQVQDTQSRPNVLDLPDTILGLIVQHQAPEDRANLMATCSQATLRVAAATTHLNKTISLTKGSLARVLQDAQPQGQSSPSEQASAIQGHRKVNQAQLLSELLQPNGMLKMPSSITDQQL